MGVREYTLKRRGEDVVAQFAALAEEKLGYSAQNFASSVPAKFTVRSAYLSVLWSLVRTA
jgi:hypothetical protein